MIARLVGAGDAKEANHVAQQALVISTVYAVIIAMIGTFIAEAIMKLAAANARDCLTRPQSLN